MRFVPVKNVEQQAMPALHRVRQGWVKARTAQANQIHGLLSEFGLIEPQGIRHITSRVPADAARVPEKARYYARIGREHFDNLSVLGTAQSCLKYA
jgi:transposase